LSSVHHNHSNRWPYFVISALWLMLAALFASQLGLSGALPWSVALKHSLAEWLPWVVLSPLIFWLAERFPVERPRWWRGIAINLPVAMVAIVLAEAVFQAIARPPDQGASRVRREAGGPADEEGPAGPERRRGPGVEGRTGPFNGPMQHLLHFHLPICLFTGMAAHAYAYFRRYQEKERREIELQASLAEARLLALQMQLQPHFLFNALNAVSTLVHTNPQAADDMIANLCELLRRALSAGAHREITLRQELDYLECYLGIERVRFGSRLEVAWEVADTTRTAIVPVLILQPIVENAVRHGVERRLGEIGRIRITAETVADRLRITVTDNGPGLPAVPTPPRGHGVGVDNTRARLATLYGDAAFLQLANVPEGGCRCMLELPLRQTLSSS